VANLTEISTRSSLERPSGRSLQFRGNCFKVPFAKETIVSGMINASFVVNAVVFSFLGVVIFWASFLIIDKLTPYHLWKEIIEEHNTALAIVVGAMSLGICIIIAAAIHA
jgi:putative membrane protein